MDISVGKIGAIVGKQSTCRLVYMSVVSPARGTCGIQLGHLIGCAQVHLQLVPGNKQVLALIGGPSVRVSREVRFLSLQGRGHIRLWTLLYMTVHVYGKTIAS